MKLCKAICCDLNDEALAYILRSATKVAVSKDRAVVATNRFQHLDSKAHTFGKVYRADEPNDLAQI